MANIKVTAVDRARLRAARKRGKTREQDLSALVDARYDRASEAVILTFGSGARMTIPRRVIPGLERESASALETVVLSPAWDALRWPLLDADVHVTGLIEGAFGSRLLALVRNNHYSKQ